MNAIVVRAGAGVAEFSGIVQTLHDSVREAILRGDAGRQVADIGGDVVDDPKADARVIGQQFFLNQSEAGGAGRGLAPVQFW